MFLLVLKLVGKEKFANCFRHYTLNSYILVKSISEGQQLYKALAKNPRIKYTFISCNKMSEERLKLIDNVNFITIFGIQCHHINDEIIKTHIEPLNKK